MVAEPLTMREAVLLARDVPAQPWSVLTTLVLDGPISRQDLANRIAERLDFAPRFRQKVSGAPVSAWVDDTGLRVAGHVRAASLASGQRVEEWLAAELARPLDRLHPLWDATILDGLGQGRTAVVFRVHPAMIDGESNVHVLQELLDESPTPIVAAAPAWRGSTEGPPNLLAGLAADPTRTLREAAAGLTGLAESILRRATIQPAERFLAGVRVDLDQVRRATVVHGCTTHDVLLALATAGIRDWLAAQGGPWVDPVALVPLGVVDRAEASAVGCQVAPQWISLPTSSPSTLERLTVLATLTQARVDTDRLVPADDLVGLAGFVPATLHALGAGQVAEGRSHTALVVNAPGPREPRYLGTRRVVGVHSVDSCVDEQRISVAITSYAGEVTLTATALAPLPRFARVVGDELGMLLRGVS